MNSQRYNKSIKHRFMIYPEDFTDDDETNFRYSFRAVQTIISNCNE